MNAARALLAAGLPDRWRGREAFVLLAIGDTAACIVEAAIEAWRADRERAVRLYVIVAARSVAGSGDTGGSGPDWRLVRSHDDRLQTLHIPTGGTGALRGLLAHADAIFASSSDDAPEAHAPALARTCARLGAPDARLVTAAGDKLNAALLASAFVRVPGAPDPDHAVAADTERPVAYRRDARNPLRIAPALRPEPEGDRHALIVGGGLAGCATAWALALHGWRSTLLERGAGFGGTAAQQPAAVFHAALHRQDSLHARFARAAAREAHAAVAQACAQHGATGDASGLLQLVDDARDIQALQACLDRLGIGPRGVQLLDPTQASALAGTTIAGRAWWQHDGGWIAPADLARSLLERAGASVQVRYGIAVDSIERSDERWTLRDPQRAPIDSARTLVLANAADAFRLLGGDWPIAEVRGQSSVTQRAVGEGRVARVALAGGGYVAPTGNGGFVFGATSQPGDSEPAPRIDDHADNLRRLGAMAPDLARGIDIDALEGRVGWRCVVRDRLPCIGRAPDASLHDGGDALRRVPRAAGLFMHTALGSRGVTSCALGGQVLAALIAGTPVPVAGDLLDALDPARFVVRSARRAHARGPRDA